MKGNIRKTLVDGLLLLIPLSVVLYILFKVYKFFQQFANKLGQFIHFESALGKLAADILAIILLILICLVLGVLSKASSVKRLVSLIEDRLLSKIPGYTFVKAYTEDFDSENHAHKDFEPVLIKFDDNTQLGFLIEKSEAGLSTIYLPGSPNPYSGSVVYVEQERIKPANISVRQAFQHLQKGGKGSKFVNEANI